MKRKVLAGGLCLALTLSLAGCGGQQAKQVEDNKQAEPTVTAQPDSVVDVKQEVEPVKAEVPPADTASKEDSEVGIIEDEKEQELEEISHDELIEVFELEYKISKDVYNSDSEETIQDELEMIRITVVCMEKSLPSDYEDQYRAWRSEKVKQDTQEEQQNVQQQPESGQQEEGLAVKAPESDTGWSYENPNVVDDGTDIEAGSVFDRPGTTRLSKEELRKEVEDPWDTQATVKYGGD